MYWINLIMFYVFKWMVITCFDEKSSKMDIHFVVNRFLTCILWRLQAVIYSVREHCHLEPMKNGNEMNTEN